MELSLDQLTALDQGEGVSVTVDHRDCVLLTAAAYQQLFDGWEPIAMQRQMADMMRDDWCDPAMDVYDG